MYDQTTRTCSSPHRELYHPKPLRPYCHSTGSTSASSTPSPPQSYSAPPTLSKSSQRPKLSKKMSSTTTKHKSVQVALEVKVERSRGFHAFFVPLARGMPPAPPSSPVFGQSAPVERKSEDRWVEDVHRSGPGMDLD